jgi:hypothetical protein
VKAGEDVRYEEGYFWLRVQVQDGGVTTLSPTSNAGTSSGLSTAAQIRIRVINVADPPSLGGSQTFSVPECVQGNEGVLSSSSLTSFVGYSVGAGRVAVLDKDLRDGVDGEALRWELLGGGASLFFISNQGVIRTDGCVLDFERQRMHTFSVKVWYCGCEFCFSSSDLLCWRSNTTTYMAPFYFSFRIHLQARDTYCTGTRCPSEIITICVTDVNDGPAWSQFAAGAKQPIAELGSEMEAWALQLPFSDPDLTPSLATCGGSARTVTDSHIFTVVGPCPLYFPDNTVNTLKVIGRGNALSTFLATQQMQRIDTVIHQ